MLQMNITPLEQEVTSSSTRSPITDFIRQRTPQRKSRKAETESSPKPTLVPIIQTRIPRAFQQLYIAASRGEDPPIRQLARTKSCLSSRSLLRDSLHEPPAHRTKHSVSFGAVKGITVENIAKDNKNALWFSRDEYSSMRLEASRIAKATYKKGSLKETSKVCSRGLEKYLDPRQSRDARVSILEHNDLAMYALASSRAVQTARQLAENDALEAFSIQHESTRKKVTRHHSSDKLLQSTRQSLASNCTVQKQHEITRQKVTRHHSSDKLLQSTRQSLASNCTVQKQHEITRQKVTRHHSSDKLLQSTRQSLASNCTVQKQHEITRQKVTRHHSSDKLLQSTRQLALNDVIDASSVQQEFIGKRVPRHHSTGKILIRKTKIV